MTKTVMNTQPTKQITTVERMKNIVPKQGDVFVLIEDSGVKYTVVAVRLSASTCTFIEVPTWNRFDEPFNSGTNLYDALEGTGIVDFRLIEQINITLD